MAKPYLIDIISTSRADYSHARSIANALEDSLNFTFRVVLSGTHCSAGSASSCDYYIPASSLGKNLVDSALALAEETHGFTNFWTSNQPAACILIGDRFELLPIANVALLFGIPIIHFFGGECDTSTCIDTEIRNALTKMAQLHCVSHSEMKKRVVALGEEEWRIAVTGNPAITNCKGNSAKFKQFARSNNWGDPPYIAVTYLPTTRELSQIDPDLDSIFSGLNDYPKHSIIWTGINADPGSTNIWERVSAFAGAQPNCHTVDSLGYERYHDLLAAAEVLVGNSSSGLLEASSYHLPVVNIGHRQIGRLYSGNVINCSNKTFLSALKEALSKDFRMKSKAIFNPFEDSTGLHRLIRLLESSLVDTPRLMTKLPSAGSKDQNLTGGLRRVSYLPDLD